MKKLSIAIALLFAIGTVSFAQDATANKQAPAKAAPAKSDKKMDKKGGKMDKKGAGKMDKKADSKGTDSKGTDKK